MTKLLHRAHAPWRLVITTAILAGLMAVPATAIAVQPDHFSAGDQYVETLPSTKGPKAADGKNRKHGGSVSLPPTIKQKLLGQGGPDAGKLIQIATSEELGAPERKSGKGKGTRGKNRSGRAQPAVPSAAIDAVGGGQAGLGWLVVAVLVITALALGAVGYQRYRDRGASS